MEDSIFTKIIKGEIPCYKIYEDEHTLAFLDIHPTMPGHTLVIPKKQVEFIWDLDQHEYTALMASVQRIGAHLRGRLTQQFVGIKVIGVDVPHTHVHLIPFDTVEEYNHIADMSTAPDHKELAEMAKKLAF